jgi:hypothetical protein
MVKPAQISLLPLAAAFAALVLACTDGVVASDRGPTPPPSHGRVFGHGSGVVAIDVDFATGRVTATRIIASTGHADLDKAALSAFRSGTLNHGRYDTLKHRSPFE